MSEGRQEPVNPYAAPPGRGATSKGSIIKAIFAALIGVLSAVYLINPTFGFFELIPDNLPIVGNIDEATATALLLSSLAYFGWDLRMLFGRRNSSVSQSRGTIDHEGSARE